MVVFSTALLRCLRYSSQVATLLAFTAIAAASLVDETHSADGKPTRLRIATTPEPSVTITHEPDRPGTVIELFNRVEKLANVKFDYTFMTWDQCLRNVRTGLIQGAFNSSYKPDRAEYGDYPLRDGKPDESRATREYKYEIYAAQHAKLTWDGERLSGNANPLAVERNASIIPRLNSLGIGYTEVANYRDMLNLLRTRRVDGIVGITESVETLLRDDPDAEKQLLRLEPPLQNSLGYLMFSKRYCASNGEVCEAVWNAIGEVRQSQEYKDVKASYY